MTVWLLRRSRPKCRAPSKERVPADHFGGMRHHTKDKGDLAVGRVIADLLGHGIQVLLPISEHLPFDLVAVSPSSRELSRVQVKYVSAKKGFMLLGLRSSHADRHGVYNKRISLDEVDAFAVFCPESDTVYYVRRDEIPADLQTRLFLRLKPSRNGQVKRTRPAGNFEGALRIFGPVAQRIEQRPSKACGGGSIPSGPANS